MNKAVLKSWAAAFIVPPLVVFLVQIPLCKVAWLSHLFETMKPSSTFILLTVLFAVPGYVPFFYFLKSRKIRLINLGIFTLLLAPYLVALWVLGLNLSRGLFDACV